MHTIIMHIFNAYNNPNKMHILKCIHCKRTILYEMFVLKLERLTKEIFVPQFYFSF